MIIRTAASVTNGTTVRFKHPGFVVERKSVRSGKPADLYRKTLHCNG